MSQEVVAGLVALEARLAELHDGLDTNDPSASIIGQLRSEARVLVELAQREAGTTTPVFQLARHAIDARGGTARDRSVRLELEGDEQAGTCVADAYVQDCIQRLLDNALDFTRTGSTVTVSVGQSEGMVRVVVVDQGGGIVGINPSHIFEAGGHESDARLPVVRDIAERFGGSVSVVATSPEGTEIELLLPVRN